MESMDKHLLWLFHLEIRKQCKFVLFAWDDLMQALQGSDSDRIWYSVQSFLVGAGNISKILWPPEPLIPGRGGELRESLSVDDDSPLWPRKFRNHFEHFDKRLEEWATSADRRRPFGDSNIGPPEGFGGISLNDMLRHYDPTKNIITYRGDEYQLKPVVEAIIELLEKVEPKILRLA